MAVYLGDGDGDGVASVLEATPKTQNADGTWKGVVISSATSYMNNSATRPIAFREPERAAPGG